jgi:plasmid stabilization system protein ParE
VKWYVLENEKLAEDFLFEFRDALLSVSRAPQGFQKRYKTVRAFALKRFPYNVYYILEKDTLSVIAIIHQKRNPKLWKKRKYSYK